MSRKSDFFHAYKVDNENIFEHAEYEWDETFRERKYTHAKLIEGPWGFVDCDQFTSISGGGVIRSICGDDDFCYLCNQTENHHINVKIHQ